MKPAPATSDDVNAILELSGIAIDDLWREAHAGSVDLQKEELARVLLAIGTKHNYGLPPGASAIPAQIGDFWRGLHLQELALAQACALGREVAWERFMVQYREPLTQAATSITGSPVKGKELADSLYAEMFGLTQRDGQRMSPLSYYSGRGSLKGFLRTTLAQRNVDHFRSTSRETPLPEREFAANPSDSLPAAGTLSKLGSCLARTLSALHPEERFLITAWFLDGRTLLEIAKLLRVHEATISRRIKGLTANIRKELIRNLQESGMSKVAAEETLNIDPRDVDINLRSLLQASKLSAFLYQVDAELE